MKTGAGPARRGRRRPGRGTDRQPGPAHPPWACPPALGLPTRISQLGIDPARPPLIALKAMANPWEHTNPRKIADAAQLEALLRQAWA